MKSISYLLVILVLLGLSACATYTAEKESLVNTLRQGETTEVRDFSSLGLKYPSNDISRIECIDKDGNAIWLYPDKNTSFVIQRKSDGKKTSVYYNTLFLQNDTLYGLKSRIVGGQRKIPLNDVDKIFVTAEIPKTEARSN